MRTALQSYRAMLSPTPSDSRLSASETVSPITYAIPYDDHLARLNVRPDTVEASRARLTVSNEIQSDIWS